MWSGNTWFQCVSHLLHSECVHNFVFVTLELLMVSAEIETKTVSVCASEMEIPRFHNLLPFCTAQPPSSLLVRVSSWVTMAEIL